MISLDLLTTFVTYVETESVVKTAKLLNISQPAVSGHLRRLEEALPVPLFVTRGRVKTLTTYGKALNDKLQEPLATLQRSVELVTKEFSNVETLTFTVGARREVIPRLTKALSFAGTLVVQTHGAEESLALLAAGKLDAAIVQKPPKGAEYFVKPLFEDDVSLIVHKQWLTQTRTAVKDLLIPTFLGTVPFLAYRDHAPFITAVLKDIGLSYDRLKVRAVCEDWAAIIAMALEGWGYSLVPTTLLGDTKHLVTAPISERFAPRITFYFVSSQSLMAVPSIREGLKFSAPD